MCVACGNIAETQTAVSLFSTTVIAVSPFIGIFLYRFSRFIEIGPVKRASRMRDYALISIFKLALWIGVLVATHLLDFVGSDVFVTTGFLLLVLIAWVLLHSFLHMRRTYMQVVEYIAVDIASIVLVFLLAVQLYQFLPTPLMGALVFMLFYGMVFNVGAALLFVGVISGVRFFKQKKDMPTSAATMRYDANKQGSIDACAALLQEGELVAFPTETVYGLGAIIWNVDQVQRIFDTKNRPADNPLIAHVADIEGVHELAPSVSAQTVQLLDAFAPGPLTVILPKKDTVPDIATAGLSTICVRIPSHPIARDLIRAAGAPLVAPSANVSGRPSPTVADHVLEDFDGKIAAVLDGGACTVGIESTIVDMTQSQPRIARPGIISAAQIEAVIGVPVIPFSTPGAAHQEIDTPISPGSKYRHYAPKAEVFAVRSWEAVKSCITDHAIDTDTLLFLANEPAPPTYSSISVHPLSADGLYAEFRAADHDGVHAIIIVIDDVIAQQEGIVNRIYKAAEIVE